MGSLSSCCKCFGLVPAEPEEPGDSTGSRTSKNKGKGSKSNKQTGSEGTSKKTPDDPKEPLINQGENESPVTIDNPKGETFDIPFKSLVGKKIKITGVPTNASGRIIMNLNSRDGRTCFHYNPRLGVKRIIRNTMSKSWGAEEKDLEMPFPFKASELFQTTITIEQDIFSVTIGDKNAFTFPRRIKDEKDPISILEIKGDVSVKSITFY